MAKLSAITIFRGGAIGDFVLTLPAIDAVRRAFPTADLRLIGRPATLALGPAASVLDSEDPRLIALHRDGPLPPATRQLFADTQRVLAYVVNAQQHFGPQLRRAIAGPVLLWDPRPPADFRGHIVDHLLSPLRQWGLPVCDRTPHIALRPGDYGYVDALASAPEVVIHLGSGSPAKCWPPANFRALASALQKRGWHTALLCGPVERERQLAGGLPALHPPDLRALAGLLAKAALFIGNDSGPWAHSRSRRHPDPDAVWPHRPPAVGTARQVQPHPASTSRRHRCNPHCGRNRRCASPPPKCAMTSYADQRRAMVREQLSQRGIRDSRVLAAFDRVPRHCYVPEALRSHAYADHPLAIGAEQTISQPYVVAYMLSALGLQGAERVLEIGTGSGYQTALLAELADQVYSIEFFSDLAAQASRVLADTGYGHVALRVGDGRMGCPEAAPFDAIVCSAAPATIPPTLTEQLAPNGRFILPLGTQRQHLVLVERSPTGLSQRKLLPVRFVPMQ